jgi:hypothetical protein
MNPYLSRLVAACLIVLLVGPAISAEPAKPGADPRPAGTGNQGIMRYEVDPAARKSLWEIDEDKDKAKLGHLVKYGGTYDYYSVLNDLAVLEQLRSLLGNELSHLFQNLESVGPIQYCASELELGGGRAHRNDVERAFVSVNVVMGTVEAVIFSYGKTTVYSGAQSYGGLHGSTKLWLHRVEIGDVLARTPKGNVVFAR